MATVAFVRHGITDWNREGRIQGWRDIPLNEAGRRQAFLVARRLSNEPFDLIFSSDLKRAAETAETIGKALRKTVTLDERLREKKLGRLEGLTVQEIVDRWGEQWRSLDLGVEDSESIRRRGLAFFVEVTARFPDQNLIVVSHDSWITETLRAILGEEIGIGSEGLGNTSVTLLHNDDGRWTCRLLNCTMHLHESTDETEGRLFYAN